LSELHQDDAVGSGVLNRYVAMLIGLEDSKEQNDLKYVHCLKAWEKSFAPFRYRIFENESGNGVLERYCNSSGSVNESVQVQNSKESVWQYLLATFKRDEWFKFEDIELEVRTLTKIKSANLFQITTA